MRIVFMGTPEFAVPSFKLLNESSHKVVAVVTPPDRRKGRGLKVIYSPVKQAAMDAKLPILQPENLKDEHFIQSLQNLKADLFAVVGFRILPEVIFDLPDKGTINLHSSLLPKYRGAAPIQWAIINGDTVTGVTTFFIQKKVDTGDLLMQKEVPILSDDNAGTLHDKLAKIGSQLLLQTIDAIEKNKIEARPQEGEATPAPKIFPQHMEIKWQNSAKEIYNQIRAFAPRPGAFTTFKDKRLKIFQATVLDASGAGTKTPGSILQVDTKSLIVQCKKGSLQIGEVQLEGKKRLFIEDFLRGIQISDSEQLGN